MAPRVYGPKAHTIPLSHSAADIAKLIRADLKAAVNGGELPDEFGYRVTSSGYFAVDVRVTGATNDWLFTTREPYTGITQRVYSEAAAALQGKVDEIRQAYNWDGSEIETDYFDVRYYGSVRIESESDARYRPAPATGASGRSTSPTPTARTAAVPASVTLPDEWVPTASTASRA